MGSVLLASCVAAMALFLPGYFLFRGVRFSRIPALCAAPLYACAAYGLLPILYYDAGIRCNAATVFLPALLLGLAVYGISRIRNPRATVALPLPAGTWRQPASPRELPFDWMCLLLYLLCGCVICAALFVSNLGAPDAIHVRYDNQTHLTLAKSFLDSGMWSSLHPSFNFNLPVESRPIAALPSSFYPSAFHALVALVATLSGVPLATAFNAVLVAFISLVYPAGMFTIMRALFPTRRGAVLAGAPLTVAFTAFPWALFVRALYPNFTGLALAVVAVGASFLLLPSGKLAETSPKQVLTRILPAFTLFWVLSLTALALNQPNAVFTAYVVMAMYVVFLSGRLVASSPRIPPSRRRPLACVAYLGTASAAVIIWFICLSLPFLQPVVTYFGNTIIDRGRILIRIASLSFVPFRNQLPLALVCLVGAVASIRNRNGWLVAPSAFFAIALFVVRTQNDALTHILGGFWYTDYIRLSACLTLCLVPVAAIGLCECGRIVGSAFRKLRPSISQFSEYFAYSITVGVIIIAVFSPSVTLPIASGKSIDTAMDAVSNVIHDMHSPRDGGVYSHREREFTRAAKQLAGDALVINYPGDGSVFAYPAEGLNVYYRTLKTTGFTDEAVLIRTGLANYASDEAVRKAVQSTGAQYVLLLDQGVAYEDGIWFNQFSHPESWDGIAAVSDATPGFEPVLSEADMRLYRIL